MSKNPRQRAPSATGIATRYIAEASLDTAPPQTTARTSARRGASSCSAALVPGGGERIRPRPLSWLAFLPDRRSHPRRHPQSLWRLAGAGAQSEARSRVASARIPSGRHWRLEGAVRAR
jgi:hypothetical protein